MHVVIEGGDACGKATQARMLLESIANASRLVSFPRYETSIGQIVLDLLKRGPGDLHNETSVSDHHLTLQTLMNADRILFQSKLKPFEYQRLLDDVVHERILICDRWWQSGFVYGTVAGLQAEQTYEWIPLHRQADLNILIDVPAHVAMTRRPARDKFEEKLLFRREVRTGYLNLWEEKQSSSAQWVVVDGTQSVQKVHQAILSAYLNVLGAA